MTWTKQGKIHGGAILLADPLPLPEGAEVTVRVEAQSPITVQTGEDFESLPFFGMWADRSEMADSAAWVRQQRQQWQQRTHRAD